jgi:hypothetical protein
MAITFPEHTNLLQREDRYPLLLSNKGSIGRYDKIVAERLKRTPPAIVDESKNANGATGPIIPVNLDFHLIRGARGAPELDNLWFSEQRH